MNNIPHSSDTQRKYLELLSSHLCLIPICSGTKKAAVGWKPYQETPPTTEEIEGWVDKFDQFAVVTGQVSGHLEIIDFDDPAFYEEWKQELQEQGRQKLLKRLPLVKTQSRGYHVYLRCPDGIGGNQKLAQKEGHDSPPTVLIETRGEGGYALLPGFSQSYELLEGDLADIPNISGVDRDFLLNTARSLNEYIQTDRIITGSSTANGNREVAPENRTIV